jgi:hypothetical protein
VRGDAILLRNSLEPEGPVLVFRLAAWREMIAGVKRAL